MNSNETTQTVSDDVKKNRKFAANAQDCEQHLSDHEKCTIDSDNTEIKSEPIANNIAIFFLFIILLFVFGFVAEVIKDPETTQFNVGSIEPNTENK